jgi:hypothetical protein
MPIVVERGGRIFKFVRLCVENIFDENTKKSRFLTHVARNIYALYRADDDMFSEILILKSREENLRVSSKPVPIIRGG